ncbi:hypothetical protein FNV43_RR08759 [Rhamnella rubrinervis]|uniref:Gamma-interferon-inducible lysosomal thiol reductase n=1 Tax=Rhamnella rubrinervis TaxID=2594499 RepID=A0A8K0H8T1_9ROSA|nr:hypothetical protein FNV43_RR08759 [Rhamnella rubrinervis]
MAFPSFLFTIAIAYTLLLFKFQSQAASYLDYGRVKALKMDSQKVNLSVYYGTLSPNSASFIVRNLAQVFDKDLVTILNLKLIPWGDAHVNISNNATVCQHGPDECELNTLEACVIDIFHDDVNKYFALIYCFEFLTIEGRHKEWETCFNSLGLPQKSVLECYNGRNGTELEIIYSNETAHLNPPIKFLPWVLVNNQPIQKDYANFATYVCKAYKGNNVPKACHSQPPT